MSNLFGDNFLTDMGKSVWGGTFIKRESILEEIPVNTKMKKTIIPINEITFREDSGWGAYVCEDENEGNLNISGEFVAQLVVGQTYMAEGYITLYRGEKQLKVEKIWNVRPVNKKGIISYLQTLKGLKSRAELIYNEFGAESIRILIEDPMLVSKRVSGIGKKSVLAWKEQLDKLSESHETISTLLGWGISMKEAKKLYDRYNDDIIRKIELNPYFLALEVRGYGFEKCDRIAKEVGISPKSSFRLQEGLIHTLKNATMSGHCYLPIDEIISNGIGMLSIRLTYQEMTRFARQYSGHNTFEYAWGNTEKFIANNLLGENDTNIFTVDYKKMMDCISNYESEKDPKKKEAYRYIICPISVDEIGEEIKQIVMQNRVISDDGKIYLKNLFYDEIAVTQRVVEIAKSESIFTRKEVEEELDLVLKEKNISLEAKQREACIEFNINKGGFNVICGSAGTGKTFVLLIVLEVKKRLYKKRFKKDLSAGIMVFAPTGKASKVATKATGMECLTVHRGLGYNPGSGFNFNEDEPLPANVVVIDESSMLDISLARSLFEAIAPGTQVILMGDIKQLPSVGPGAVLQDLLDSDVINVIELDVIKRQGLLSGIVAMANDIIEGKMIKTAQDTKDAYVVKRETISGCQRGILDSYKRVLTFEGYSHDEIQVLAPQRTGSAGTYMINYILQREFNPGNEENKVLYTKFQARPNENSQNPESFELYFKKGDKVIHIKNNYDMELYEKTSMGVFKKLEKTGITNGECGRIEDIQIIPGAKKSEKITRIIVKYEDYYVFYDEVDELELAWCLTIHKSQGSAWKAVILPMVTSYWNMLDRCLLYTGVTRARNFVVVVGSERAIHKAINTQKASKRYTSLKERLQQEVKVA